MQAMVEAEPAPLSIDLQRTAVVIIDMQRDFLLPGGFGEALGNDVSRLGSAVAPCRKLLGLDVDRLLRASVRAVARDAFTHHMRCDIHCAFSSGECF